MLIKEFERIDPGHIGTKVIINLEGIDVLSDYRPKGQEKATENACTVVLRCGMVMGLKAKKDNIFKSMTAYRG